MNYPHRNKELEKKLLNLLPSEKFKQYFINRLTSNQNGYWQTISEMRSIHIFHNVLKISLVGVEVKTVNKNVDFVCDWLGGKVFIEVKGFRARDLIIAKQGNIPKDKTGDNIIERALSRSKNQFHCNACNILVIADEDTSGLSLYRNHLLDLGKTPETYMGMLSYRKTSAIMILGDYVLDKDMYLNYKIYYNPNPECCLLDSLIAKFNEYRVNNY